MHPVSDTTKQKIREFTEQCFQIRRHFYVGTSSLTPVNYTEEADKFFASNTYNPHFFYKEKIYPDFTTQLNRIEDLLESISVPPDLRDYLEAFLSDTRLLEQTARSIGTPEFASYAKELFNLDRPFLQNYLNKSPEITISQETRSELHTAVEIAEIFKKTLKEKYNITDYEVKIDHFNDHIVRVGSRKVILGGKIKRYRKSIERLIIHELESHVLQRINSRKDVMLNLMTFGDRTLYSEGLAVYNEVKSEKLTLKMYQVYSLRLQAVRLLDLSFREIYDYLMADRLPEKMAYQITYRVKRGLHNTASPGGFPKDAFYLLGYMAVKDYVAQGGSLKNLYKVRTPTLKNLIEKYNLTSIQDPLLPHFLSE